MTSNLYFFEILAHCVLVSFFLRFIITLLEKEGVIDWFENKFTETGICYFCLCFWMAVIYVLFYLFVDFTIFGHVNYSYVPIVFISPILTTDLMKW